MSDLLKRRRCGTAWTGSGDVAHTCVRGKGHKGVCRSDSGAMKPNWGKFAKSLADGDELVLLRKSDLTGKGDSVILKSDAPIETLSKDEAQYLMGSEKFEKKLCANPHRGEIPQATHILHSRTGPYAGMKIHLCSGCAMKHDKAHGGTRRGVTLRAIK